VGEAKTNQGFLLLFFKKKEGLPLGVALDAAGG
jgi:hypothetical protein